MDKFLNFGDWVKQQNSKKPIDHSDWSTCAFGQYIKYVDSFEELRGTFDLNAVDIGMIAEWLRVHNHYCVSVCRTIEWWICRERAGIDTYGDLAIKIKGILEVNGE